ncbi:hypothetical protein HAV22_13650 [Massilia sp. TW-1]|uniref:Uncharacterized protein n=1 Tax=Telluria antibiotica TaxID=2717319 RepID=A0ABX0PBF0_9BURK|nr:hypothetical protein [Telluria antibiotica]NIA54682.1 hypothetical protein [Telluria antibiotica]
MEKDLAKIIALTAFRSAADLGNLVPVLQDCVGAERTEIGVALAMASAEINRQVLGKIFERFPELAEEFEEKVRKFGHPF